MKYQLQRLSMSLVAGLLLATTAMTAALASDYQLGTIHINHPVARATVPQQSTGGAYLDLDNVGKTDDTLVKLESSVANEVELHSMSMQGDVMKMRSVSELELKAGQKISMHPGGGYHIMLLGLKHQLKASDQFDLTLYFAKAGKIKVLVQVEPGTMVK